ncbi:hypothetical protein RIR_jg31489.t1 [Rhizophagus irregularis DAOM 181602=DAOM 197198]|nr:hypothetical protein RIR_jg31489.t1 [Rhizophagus irregularis DAOM 181602=DAOM 197198]
MVPGSQYTFKFLVFLLKSCYLESKYSLKQKLIIKEVKLGKNIFAQKNSYILPVHDKHLLKFSQLSHEKLRKQDGQYCFSQLSYHSYRPIL